MIRAYPLPWRLNFRYENSHGQLLILSNRLIFFFFANRFFIVSNREWLYYFSLSRYSFYLPDHSEAEQAIILGIGNTLVENLDYACWKLAWLVIPSKSLHLWATFSLNLIWWYLAYRIAGKIIVLIIRKLQLYFP